MKQEEMAALDVDKQSEYLQHRSTAAQVKLGRSSLPHCSAPRFLLSGSLLVYRRLQLLVCECVVCLNFDVYGYFLCKPRTNSHPLSS